MSEITTFTDFATVTLAGIGSPAETKNLKTLCLYNDTVILNTGDKLYDVFIEQLYLTEKIDKNKLKKIFISIEDVIGQNEKQPFVDVEQVDELLGKENVESAMNIFLEEECKRNNRNIEEVKKDFGTMYEWSKIFFYSTMSLLANLDIYSKLNSIMPCSITGFSNSTNLILNSYINNQARVSENITIEKTISEKVEYEIPSLRQLSWNEIFEIRNDNRAKKFRHWINENKEEIHNNGLRNIIYQEFWNVFNELKPNTLGNILKATLGNIPLPTIFNPVSVASGIHDIYKSQSFNNKYSWLLFIHDLQERERHNMDDI